jgi:hypothetical protein
VEDDRVDGDGAAAGRGQGKRVVGASLDGLGQPEGKITWDRASS